MTLRTTAVRTLLLGPLLLAAVPEPARAQAQAPAQAPRTVALDDALRELEAQNLTLAQARARVEEAAGLSRQALASALPTLLASGSYTRNSDQAVVPFGRIAQALNITGPTDLYIQPQDVWAASATLRLPLVAPSAWADVAAARSAERATGANTEAVRQQLRLAMVQTAWSASAGEEIVAASERAVEVAEEQARAAQRALEAGTGVQLAVLQARTAAVRRQSDLVRARADLQRAQLAGGVLLGRAQPVRIPLAPAAAPPSSGPEATEALVAEALERRPELRAWSAQVEAADQQLLSARLRWLPQLGASGSAFVQDVPLPTGKEEGWRVTLDLTWALYDGGARYGRAHQAQAQGAEARAAAEGQRVAVRQEVLDASREVGVAAEQARLAEDQARLAGEEAATARRGFAGGVASSLDVLEANDRLFQAEVGRAGARARLGAALAALDRAAGRG